ncbi:high mobility group B protein 9-like isoform X2 [Selaginella moellendorffii]|uniref:high mobility group B protein 9-like isoform X2 n=1 Tax=Selaginella moellendorffii TaxID=88036 RepID=UPI000D1CEDF8|nr:high mobility group B protein 9-like isoform X2 [Selaginella moellendorffii]|eukprot:XP_024541876.1 high mobility group B protein 9-like isoform X2 [Selaginella moellendorffii]
MPDDHQSSGLADAAATTATTAASEHHHSPQTPPPPPLTSPSPEHSNNNNGGHAQAPTSSEVHHALLAAAAASATAPPRSSEMLNLPRDFLSLRPQEPPPLSHSRLVPKFETKDAPLITVQMASPPHNYKCTSITTTTSTTSTATPVFSAGYPRALASHEEVLRDKELFLDTLRRLHGSMGFKSLTIPTIGGTQLDLHLLYREVTARGGLHQVIKDRIWKEIKAVFHFPPTTTNASYVLRKYYSSLLHHYEQVYFFRNQGAVVSAPGDADAAADPGNATTNCIGQTVTGSIVGKFEHGYLVSVTVGSEALKGVLYNVPPGEYVPQFTTTSKLPTSNGAQLSECVNADGELRRKRRRRLGLRKKDPNAPKLNRSAYNFFFAEQRARIRLLQPNREISRMIGDSWSKLTDEQRLPYKERGLVDKERYRKEIKQYREKMRGLKDVDMEGTTEEAHEEEDVSDDPEQEVETEDNGVPADEEQRETLEFKSILSAQAS